MVCCDSGMPKNGPSAEEWKERPYMIYVYKASGVRLRIITLVCVALELEVGSSGSVSSLMVLLDITQPGKLDDSDPELG